MGMQKYEALIGTGNDMTDFNRMIDSMPKVVQTMWGISELDISKPIGYFGVLFPFLLLMGGIHASMLGSNIISKEERDKTVEFLMVKPVSRNKIITSKMLASIFNILVFNVVTFITSTIILNKLSVESILSPIILAAIGMFLLQLLFMSIGIGMATMNRNYKKTGSITIGILLGTYFLSLIIDMSDKLEIFKFLTPFKYFDAKKFIITNTLNTGYVILTLVIIISILTLSYKRYTKRDLNF
jgi:ABC-2 type transport system permease protein